MMDQKTNSIVSELHDEIYGLHCDIGRLEQEKDQCEATIEYLRQDCVDWEDKYRAVSAENAKLRKLIGDLYAFYAWADGAIHYGGEPAVFPDDRREVEQRMFELGMLEAREV